MKTFDVDALELVSGGIALRMLPGASAQGVTIHPPGAPAAGAPFGAPFDEGLGGPQGFAGPNTQQPFAQQPFGQAPLGQQPGPGAGFQQVPFQGTLQPAQPAQSHGSDFLQALPQIVGAFTSILGALGVGPSGANQNGAAPRTAAPAAQPAAPAARAPLDEASMGPPAGEQPGADGAFG